MQVAKIKSTSGGEFFTNNIDEKSLAKLKDVELVEITEMEPEDFWQIPATSESVEFFNGVEGL